VPFEVVAVMAFNAVNDSDRNYTATTSGCRLVQLHMLLYRKGNHVMACFLLTNVTTGAYNYTPG